MCGLYPSHFPSYFTNYFIGVNCQIVFQPGTTQYCDGEPVEYQCSVTGSGVFALRWRILRDNGTEFGLAAYTSTIEQDLDPIGGVFIPERLSPLSSVTPLVSNISFTATSSINGYTIVCDDSVLGDQNVTITGTCITGTCITGTCIIHFWWSYNYTEL